VSAQLTARLLRNDECLGARRSGEPNSARGLLREENEAAEYEQSMPDRELDASLRFPSCVGNQAGLGRRQDDAIRLQTRELAIEGKWLEPARAQPERAPDPRRLLYTGKPRGHPLGRGSFGAEHASFYVAWLSGCAGPYALLARDLAILTRR
jgi:hypothetical protein